MNATRASEQLLEQQGASATPPDSVKDWHADRLSMVLGRLEVEAVGAVAERAAKGLGGQGDLEKVTGGIASLKQLSNSPEQREELAAFLEREMPAARKSVEALLANTGEDELAHQPGVALAFTAYKVSAELSAPTYMGLTADSCKPGGELERICDKAHALVKSGYVTEKDISTLETAVLDKTSAHEQAGKVLYQVGLATGLPAWTSSPPSSSESHFLVDSHKVTVSVQQSAEQVLPHLSKDNAVAAVFSHELGHYLSEGKLLNIVDQGVQAIERQGGAEGAMVREFVNVPEAYLKADAPRLSTLVDENGKYGVLGRTVGLENSPWLGAAAEMYGDCFAIAAEKAQHGNAAAIEFANGFAVRRDSMNLSFLDTAQTLTSADYSARANSPIYGETHHTTAAIDHFRDAIKEGRLDAVQTPSQLNALIGEAVVKGLVAEYSQVRSAELNLHHVKDGAAISGLPEGISKEAVLLAELHHNLADRPGQPKIIVPEERLKDLPEGTKVHTLTVKDEHGKTQELHIANQVPRGVTAEQAQVDGIKELRSASHASAERHLEAMSPEMNKALGGRDTQGEHAQQAQQAKQAQAAPAAVDMSR